MKETLCDFEVSKLLKEKGFDLATQTGWLDMGCVIGV
jgi:hypothetical protein